MVKGTEATVAYAALALSRPPPFLAHLGIIYKPSKSSLRYLHLAFHHALKDEDLGALVGEYAVILPLPPLSENKARNLAMWCRLIAKKNKKKRVPFAFMRKGISFKPASGVLHLKGAPSGAGFTCSTFVIAVFELVKETLLKPSDWPTDREEDEDWQKRILPILREHSTSEHAEAVANDVGKCIRVRAEETAAALTSETLPATFSHCADAGATLLQKIPVADSPEPPRGESNTPPATSPSS